VAVAVPQHLVALHKANTLRLKRAGIKRAVYASEVAVREAVERPECASARLFDVLMYQRRWGPTRARKALHEVGASEATICRNLTPRQLGALDRALS
jgi:hypothetical protein